MKHLQTQGTRAFFRIAAQTARSQGATMVLQPGQSTGGKDNVHKNADQWLFVSSGAGRAIVNRRKIRLKPGSLLLINAGETHEIMNDGRQPLVTINIYAPPAY